MNIGETIKHLRKYYGLSQETLAERMELSRSRLSYIESGRVNPTIQNIKTLGDILGLSLEKIHWISENMNKPNELTALLETITAIYKPSHRRQSAD